MTNPIIDLRAQRPNTADEAAAPKGATPPTPAPTSQSSSSENSSILSWEALEFPERKKDEGVWLTRTAMVALPLALTFLLLKNLLGAIVIILGAFAFLLAAFRKPTKVRFHIDDKGIRINEHFHPFTQLVSFWIFTDPPQERIVSIRQKNMLQQNLALPLGETDPQKVRAALLAHLQEEEQQPSAVDALMRRIGF
ncbi:MAG: hypothetical protein A2682_02590 [Candidatus Terrybacteria bacterium RIFCSPHIGHO2_01_FULL_58_15]|uniref:DUF5673 domain-containing protein n=1 Tax=Terrybacteria sp. (strain RIFCSPHIGHO2_01_FULL_58_15) TaxID=1802363 RepID=A0A1G2PLY5_TERXR|nr:MAG: hypothetical protein A2682_02590 [Candidatus Terrybacteria bacterium RIFCSPHIGHO2_01_FULL_58_15]